MAHFRALLVNFIFGGRNSGQEGAKKQNLSSSYAALSRWLPSSNSAQIVNSQLESGVSPYSMSGCFDYKCFPDGQEQANDSRVSQDRTGYLRGDFQANTNSRFYGPHSATKC